MFDKGVAYDITGAVFQTNLLRTVAVHVAPAVHVTNFDSLSVVGNAKFIDAQFYGPMSLNYATIGGQLDVSSAVITGTAEFNTVAVKGDADFNWTLFRRRAARPGHAHVPSWEHDDNRPRG